MTVIDIIKKISACATKLNYDMACALTGRAMSPSISRVFAPDKQVKKNV